MNVNKTNKRTSKNSKKQNKDITVNDDPSKNNIKGWCKSDKLKCVDERLNNPNFAWTLLISDQVMIYKQRNYPDRIYIQSQINIALEHQALIESNLEIKNNLLLNLPATAASLDIHLNFQNIEGKITGLSIVQIHFAATISKADMLRNFMRVQQIHRTVLNQLRNELGLELQQAQAEKTKPDASDAGIR